MNDPFMKDAKYWDEFCDNQPSKCDGDMILPEFDTRITDSEPVATGSDSMMVDELPTITVPDNILETADNPKGMKIN